MCKKCNNGYDDFHHCDNCGKYFSEPETSLWHTRDKYLDDIRACEKCCKKLDKYLKEYENENR